MILRGTGVRRVRGVADRRTKNTPTTDRVYGRNSPKSLLSTPRSLLASALPDSICPTSLFFWRPALEEPSITATPPAAAVKMGRDTVTRAPNAIMLHRIPSAYRIRFRRRVRHRSRPGGGWPRPQIPPLRRREKPPKPTPPSI